MGKLSDLAIQLEETGIPEEVYREASVGDAIRLINGDSINLVRIDGRWALGHAVHVDYHPQTIHKPTSYQ